MAIEQGEYPLEWPLGHARTPVYRRRRWKGTRRWKVDEASRELEEELRRMGAQELVISCNLRRFSGTPGVRLEDPGVAIYFTQQIREPQTGLRTVRLYAMSCDRYESVAGNLRGLTATIESMRRIKRHGSSQLAEQAMSGFKMLTAAPDVQPPWYEVLGCDESKPLHEVEKLYKRMLRELHPDHGGSEEDTRRLNHAIAEAREILT